jgi:DNA repair protein RecN (Recombination protein N)
MILTELNLQNFILIRQSRIPFGAGLNIISGETGAGKSILLEAIMILLGKRLSPHLKFETNKPCVIEGEFEFNLLNTKDQEAKSSLEDLGFAIEDHFVIRRVLDKSGRQKTFIADQHISTQAVRNLFAPLIEICGQHEFHGLLRPERHLALLEAGFSSQESSVLKTFRNSFATYQTTMQALEALEQKEQAWQSKSDFLNFQKDFFKNKQPESSTEDVELETKINQLQQGENLRSSLSEAIQLLEDEDQGIVLNIKNVLNCISSLKASTQNTPALTQLCTDISEKASELSQSLQSDLTQLGSQSENDLDKLNERLYFLQTLKRKYGPTLADVCTYIASVESQIEEAENFTEQKELIKKEIKNFKNTCLTEAKKLQLVRCKKAKALGKNVNTVLKTLGIPTPNFEVKFKPILDQPSSRGVEDAEFFMSFNPGKEPAAVCKIASGGELSRLMLAYRAVNTVTSDVGIYLFDEVDAGVGGQTAKKIGAYLYKIAHIVHSNAPTPESQVICITHLPQIAVHADQHLLVEKQTEAKSTAVTIRSLSHKNERLHELVRMLGSDLSNRPAIETVQNMQKDVKQARVETP